MLQQVAFNIVANYGGDFFLFYFILLNGELFNNASYFIRMFHNVTFEETADVKKMYRAQYFSLKCNGA